LRPAPEAVKGLRQIVRADSLWPNTTGSRAMRRSVLLLAGLLAAGSGLTAIAAGGSGNSANDLLLSMPPEEQAKQLTKGIKGCVGESPFPMGVTTAGKAKGYAYWSVRCQDGRSFAIQITPKSQATPADCKALEGSGKECFKKF
jgi:hypothetical protein